MTEMVNGMSQSQDTSSAPVQSSPAPAESAPSSQPAREERVFRQSEVDNIVKRAKNDAVDTYRRMSVEQPQYVQQKYGEAPVHQPATNFHSEDVRKIAAEEVQRARDEWTQKSLQHSQEQDAHRTAQEFFTKISTGKEKYQDFEKVTGDIEYARFPSVVTLLAKHVDNASDVLYELGKDRIKMANLESLAERSPRDAVIQAHRLSQSIRDNEAAGKMRLPNEPLSQMRPSNTGTDNGVMSVKDYRAKYKV
jgi:hypothetical protein